MEPDYTTIAFTNPTGEDFTGYWGGKPYTIEAGQTKNYPMFLAKHLAKHLTDRIIGTGNPQLRDEARRAEVEKTILGEVVMEDEPKESLSEGEKVARKVAEIEKKVKASAEPFAELKEAKKVTKKKA